MNPTRRLWMVSGLPFIVGLAGCARAPRDLGPTYCHRSKLEHYIKGPCIAAPIPSPSADADAKRFESTSGWLTVFVVRQNWLDGQDIVRVIANQRESFETLPDTLMRLRFTPGTHTLTLLFGAHNASIQVHGQAGDVRFVHLLGAGLSWRVAYRWNQQDADRLRHRALKTRLVADAWIS